MLGVPLLLGVGVDGVVHYRPKLSSEKVLFFLQAQIIGDVLAEEIGNCSLRFTRGMLRSRMLGH